MGTWHVQLKVLNLALPQDIIMAGYTRNAFVAGSLFHGPTNGLNMGLA